MEQEILVAIRDIVDRLWQYCEFGGTAKKCEDWLKAEEPDLWNRLYSDGMCYVHAQTDFKNETKQCY